METIAEVIGEVNVVVIGTLHKVQTPTRVTPILRIDDIGDNAGEHNFAEPGIAMAVIVEALWTRGST